MTGTPVNDELKEMEYVEGDDCVLQISIVLAGSFLTIFAAMAPLVTADSPADEWVTRMSFNWILAQFLFGCAIIGLSY